MDFSLKQLSFLPVVGVAMVCVNFTLMLSAIPSSFWLPQVSMFFLIDQVWLRQELLKTSKKIQALGATEPADPGVLFR